MSLSSPWSPSSSITGLVIIKPINAAFLIPPCLHYTSRCAGGVDVVTSAIKRRGAGGDPGNGVISTYTLPSHLLIDWASGKSAHGPPATSPSICFHPASAFQRRDHQPAAACRLPAARGKSDRQIRLVGSSQQCTQTGDGDPSASIVYDVMHCYDLRQRHVQPLRSTR